MTKIILSLILAVSINLATMKKSEAGIAAAVAIAGGGAAAPLAYAGLSSFVVGYIVDVHEDAGGWAFLFFAAIGLIILDDGSAELQLPSLSIEELSLKGLTSEEITSVLNNQEELEAVFNDSMNSDQTVEEASARWEIARDIYGTDAISGFYKTLSNK